MNTKAIISGIAVSLLLAAGAGMGNNSYAAERKWNNPESKKRYEAARQQQANALREESKAWQNYDKELAKAQRDVRRVRDDAYKGALSGGAAGAAWGAAKGAGKGVYERGKDQYKQTRK